jgi:hypothetical protein
VHDIIDYARYKLSLLDNPAMMQISFESVRLQQEGRLEVKGISLLFERLLPHIHAFS